MASALVIFTGPIVSEKDVGLTPQEVQEIAFQPQSLIVLGTLCIIALLTFPHTCIIMWKGKEVFSENLNFILFQTFENIASVLVSSSLKVRKLYLLIGVIASPC